MNKKFVEVAVEAPLKSLLTYEISPNLGDIKPGDSVQVPLGSRKIKGVVFSLTNTAPKGNFAVKSIFQILEGRPNIPPQYLSWLKWISSYYMHPIGQVASLAFPPLKKSTKTRKSKKTPIIPEVDSSAAPILTEEQAQCIKDIKTHPGYGVHLLHGVTGSGKTEVYLNLIEDVLAQGKKAMVLVPEISLTPQLVQRFAARFQDQVAVIHSHLTDREKTNQWWSMVDESKQILIGARSALFCPIKNLGIIIMDEEHEPSFKQDEKLKYHARDTAIVLSRSLDCPIILGSATPCLETWNNAMTKKFHYHKMSYRVSDRKMPIVNIIDMREERGTRKDSHNNTLPFWMSRDFYSAIKETLERNEQAALFLNRRGIAQTVLCQSCGYVYECPNCAISLTLHAKNHLVCHYCDFTAQLTEQCPECPDGEIHPLGLGTELLEDDIKKLFPEARVGRADRDEIQNRSDLEKLISAMENHTIDILIGTQMIAKGLDFKNLTTVGLVMADVGFNMPDFRASERSFQLLTQVSGRAGRHSESPGQVFIQTYNPGHLSITHTKANNFEGFAQEELCVRKELSYPPFGRIATLKIQGIHLQKVSSASDHMAHRAFALKEKFAPYESIMILGPVQAPMAKLRGKFRYQILIKSPEFKTLNKFCEQLMFDLKWIPSGTKVQIDIDPINML